MEGRLFKYGPDSCHTAFQTGSHKRHCIFVGGLTDGLLATKYIEPLAESLDAAGWSLVQTLLSSSYRQYGISSIDQDAKELNLLVQHLKSKEATHVVIAGHSTGCQDALRYVQKFPDTIDGVILQAPVSDREYLELWPATSEKLRRAQRMVAEGAGQELMPRNTDFCAPMCADRYVALVQRLGDDDHFSWDFSDSELEARVAHMQSLPVLVMMSGAEEYVPPNVNKGQLAQRLALAMGAEWVLIAGGDHSLSNHTEEAVQRMLQFVTKLD
eukprot:CAMPEP_0198206616 /NCGR_PEP_ID=MMETSP1445-20131203/10175_1 /TAXON_ID=36898 /ORGANISM="Pyramimonas sp., Strain CCMP2087" /LENGTH=269 /DNA_ID=CAMNT_0043879389 /DNA_START=168 /DNA_END=977 /DNA_ORIENTATION=+